MPLLERGLGGQQVWTASTDNAYGQLYIEHCLESVLLFQQLFSYLFLHIFVFIFLSEPEGQQNSGVCHRSLS